MLLCTISEVLLSNVCLSSSDPDGRDEAQDRESGGGKREVGQLVYKM